MEKKINIFWKNATPEEKKKFKKLVKRINQYGGKQFTVTHKGNAHPYKVTYNKNTGICRVNDEQFGVQLLKENVYGITNNKSKTSYFKSSSSKLPNFMNFTYRNGNGNGNGQHVYISNITVSRIKANTLGWHDNSCYMDSLLYCLFLEPNHVTTKVLEQKIVSISDDYNCPNINAKYILTYLRYYIVPYIRGGEGYGDQHIKLSNAIPGQEALDDKVLDDKELDHKELGSYSFRNLLSKCFKKNIENPVYPYLYKEVWTKKEQDPGEFLQYLNAIFGIDKGYKDIKEKYTIYFENATTKEVALEREMELSSIHENRYVSGEYFLSYSKPKKNIILIFKLPNDEIEDAKGLKDTGGSLSLQDYYNSVIKGIPEYSSFEEETTKQVWKGIDISIPYRAKIVTHKQIINGGLIILSSGSGAIPSVDNSEEGRKKAKFRERQKYLVYPSETLYLEPPLNNTPSNVYKLVSICVMIGDSHYGAYLKINNVWYAYNDLENARKGKLTEIGNYDQMVTYKDSSIKENGLLYFYHKIE